MRKIIVGAAGPVATPPEERRHKRYVLSVVEIVAMNTAVNVAGQRLMEPAHFKVIPDSIRRNLRGPWVVDDDPCETLGSGGFGVVR